MNIKKLETLIHTKIPMTKLMKLQLKEINEEYLQTTAPLDININDKGTAFGGSINSLATISGWCLCNLLFNKSFDENINILIIKNESSFLAHITKDLTCTVELPNKNEIEVMLNKLQTKGKGSIKLHVKILEDEKLCFSFKGVYVVKKVL